MCVTKKELIFIFDVQYSLAYVIRRDAPGNSTLQKKEKKKTGNPDRIHLPCIIYSVFFTTTFRYFFYFILFLGSHVVYTQLIQFEYAVCIQNYIQKNEPFYFIENGKIDTLIIALSVLSIEYGICVSFLPYSVCVTVMNFSCYIKKLFPTKNMQADIRMVCLSAVI